MANEQTYVGKPNWFLPAALNMLLFEGLVDRTDLSGTISYYGSVNGTNSTTSNVAKATFDDAMAAANTDEVTPIGLTDVDNDKAPINVARQALARAASDLFEMVGEGGPRPNIAKFGADMVNAAILRITDMICGLFASLSTIVGDSGEATTVDDLFDALYELIRQRAGGQKTFVGSPQQIIDFTSSLRSEGLKLIPPDAGSMLASLGNHDNFGFHGTFSQCQIWSSDSVTTTGPDSDGAVYTKNCFGYMDGVPTSALARAAQGSSMAQTPNGSTIFVEFDRDALGGITKVVGNLYFGASEIDDPQGVRLRSAA